MDERVKRLQRNILSMRKAGHKSNIIIVVIRLWSELVCDMCIDTERVFHLLLLITLKWLRSWGILAYFLEGKNSYTLYSYFQFDLY